GRQMRQAGAHDDERRAGLRQLVAGCAQGGDVLWLQVLHLVDEQGDAGPDVRGKLGDVGEQFHQVDLDVPGIRSAARRGHVDARLPAVTEFGVGLAGAQRECLEHAEHFVDAVRRAVSYGEIADRAVQGGRQGSAQFRLRAGLDLAGAPAATHRHRTQFAEQHGLADAAQAGEYQAAFRAAARHAFQHDLEGLQLTFPAGELRGSLSGAGGERIAYRVHVIERYPDL